MIANILDEAEAFDREFTSRARRNLMNGRTDGQRAWAIEGGNRYGGTTSSSRTHVSDFLLIFSIRIVLLYIHSLPHFNFFFRKLTSKRELQ